MIPRPDLLDERSPEGIEVYQLTEDPKLPSCHIYMEAQIFTPDSRRFILHRAANPHGSDAHDPRHRYQLCDLDDRYSLHDLTEETGATAPSLSPDGCHLYYFVNETETNGGRLTLKRVAIDGTDRQTLYVLDTALPDTTYRPSLPYPLSTISSDGMRVAISAFLGDGSTDNAPWGLLVFDLERAACQLILSGQSWCNVHPQYCRALDEGHAHVLLVQENHGNSCDRSGKCRLGISGLGADIHVICDDGSTFRNLPWGRDGQEQCQGHQCWIGRSHTAITSTGVTDSDQFDLVAGTTAPFCGHTGRQTFGAIRNELSRLFSTPRFSHFATDISGNWLITDYLPHDSQGIYLAPLPADPLREPIGQYMYLLNPRTSMQKGHHVHPFLSPDGTTAYFNSNESGTLQAYAIRGLERCRTLL